VAAPCWGRSDVHRVGTQALRQLGASPSTPPDFAKPIGDLSKEKDRQTAAKLPFALVLRKRDVAAWCFFFAVLPNGIIDGWCDHRLMMRLLWAYPNTAHLYSVIIGFLAHHRKNEPSFRFAIWPSRVPSDFFEGQVWFG
jgi:hypothetical protein